METVVKKIFIFIIGGILGFLINKYFFKEGNIPQEEYITNNQNITPENILEENIFKKGNIASYNELRISYIDKDLYPFLPFSIIMANRYKYEQAYHDIFYYIYYLNITISELKNIKEKEDYDLTGLDIFTQKYAIENLKKSAELGNTHSKKILEIYKKQGKYQFK